MIKRRLYKQEHGDKDDGSSSDSSSSSSSSDSDSEAEPQYDEEVDIEAVSEPKEDEPQPSSGSGYESEDSSGNEVDCEPGGLLINDSDEGHGKQGLYGSQSTGSGNVEASTIPEKEDFDYADFTGRVLKFESVFKCRLCPRIVCLSEESLRAHLQSKRHARSEKLLSEGRLKLMLNSDGEIEEDQETHAERHARTVAVAKDLTADKKKKNRGRQRQRLRSKRKRTSTENLKKQSKKPVKRKRRNED